MEIDERCKITAQGIRFFHLPLRVEIDNPVFLAYYDRSHVLRKVAYKGDHSDRASFQPFLHFQDFNVCFTCIVFIFAASLVAAFMAWSMEISGVPSA
jgi:hypothetical protein